jgi:HAD superfamily hydrolase (TIGR01509 family)
MNVLKTVPKLSDIISRNTKALIFDMDGTLLNTELVHAQALSKFLNDSNHNIERLLNDFCGVSEPEVFRILKDRNVITTKNFDEFIEQKNIEFENILKDDELLAKLFLPELKDLILEAKSKNIKIAIVTASESNTTELFLSKLKIKNLFDLIVTRNDTERTKPDPMPYIHSLSKLKVKHDEVIIFEDSETGLAAARASKAQFFKVTWY